MSEPRDPRQTDAWGIDRYYQDAFDEWQETPPESIRAIRRAMGGDPDADAPPAEAEARVLFLQPGHPACIFQRGTLVLESGESLDVDGPVPANLPFGYHVLHPERDPAPVQVIVSPGRCYLPEDFRSWGWSVQLYALRSKNSWGMGDLRDLGDFAAWSSSELGAGMLMINPLHAPLPCPPIQPSPYYPSSRRFRNPLYLRIEDIPGVAEAGCGLERLASAGRELNRSRLIDRDAVFRLKMEALECIWKAARHDPAFDEWARREGREAERYGTFCALSERFGCGWPQWPSEYATPDAPALRQFVRDNVDRVRFHMWIQWLLDDQLAKNSYAISVMQDMPIGVDPAGADAWMWQDVLAKGVSVGAPPDKFNTGGQDWGLPPFIPGKLRQAAYHPFIQIIRSTLRHAGGLRIDHVLGLFRLFWVPHGLGPAKGAYVRYNADELLSIVALESHRANAFIVGEDLGTVEPGVSEKLQRHGILSYRVFWFEKDPPGKWPVRALSAVSTHDLPTIAGMWTGSDLEAQRRLGLKPNEADTQGCRDLLESNANVRSSDTIEQVILKTHEALASAPSKVLAAQLDDALAVEERPNMPATTGDQWPNWSMALPATLESICEHPFVREVAATLQRP